MDHQMGLYEEYYQQVINGNKIYEVRLNDGKRREIKVGDTITFQIYPDSKACLMVEVLELQKYDTFEEMYRDLPFDLIGCKGWTMEDMLKGTYEIYSKEEEVKWGTVAIKMKVVA
ncbi:ASCH domain-containing protein [Aquibacillus kalidii]|uniref:ASCH domain-containing protein n=1 Tax=Aquibacillus kalidii TaxID=2762597 RepID=UPI001C9A0C54|nr:ASCH domain-containing protein [Aquibacillus kalidii]